VNRFSIRRGASKRASSTRPNSTRVPPTTATDATPRPGPVNARLPDEVETVGPPNDPFVATTVVDGAALVDGTVLLETDAVVVVVVLPIKSGVTVQHEALAGDVYESTGPPCPALPVPPLVS
jgi:hypothetical protein